MENDAPQDVTQPRNPYPSVAGVVTIEAPRIKEETADSSHPQLDLEERSIRNTDQAWNLCKSTESANRYRSQRAAIMELEYSGQPPFSADDKREKGQSWESNVNTGVLQGIVDRKTLRFIRNITSQVYLTRSSLPTTYSDWKKKSDLFDIHTTRMVQSWENYASFLNQVFKEDVLHGYTFAVFLDPFTWKPVSFKQDVAYVPDEADQHSSRLQFFVVKQDYLLHEFLELFRDEEAAKDMGFNVDNCVQAAANSCVKNPREDMMVTEFRKFADFVSDGILGLTYATSGPRVVKTYLLWNREYDGKISFWIIERETGKLIRFASKIYDSFPDAVTLFSFQPGNGHLHSSKGLGRMLIGTVKMLEKIRNRMADNVMIANLKILKTPAKDRNKLQPIVQSPFIVIDSSINLETQSFEVDPELYAGFDKRAIDWIQQAGGSYIAEVTDAEGRPRTATEASQDYQRELENQDITEDRSRNQTMEMVGTMQRRAYSDDNISDAQRIFKKITAAKAEDQNAYAKLGDQEQPVRALVNMLKDGLNEEEIKILRNASPLGYAHTDDAVTSQGILAVKKGFTNNANVDQVELDKRSIEALAGPDAAKALIIDEPDQTLSAEARRMQLSESTTMATLGVPVDVSPRDNHLIHGLQVMEVLQALGPKISNIGVDGQVMKMAELNLNHLGAHLDAYMQRGGVSQNPQFKTLNDFYNNFKEAFQKAIQIHATHNTLTALTGAAPLAPSGTPPPPATGAPGAPGPGTNAPPGTVAAGMTQSPPAVPQAGVDLGFKPQPITRQPPQPAAAQ
jgi:hypothetical protein